MMRSFCQWLDKAAYFLFTRVSNPLRSWKILSAFGRWMGVPNIGVPCEPSLTLTPHPRILIIRSDALGDFLLTLPFIAGMRACFPDAHLALLVAPAWQSFAAKFPMLDEVISCSLSTNRWEAIRNVARAIRFGCAELEPRKFDWAIVPRWDADFTDAYLLAFFSFAPVRIAFSEKSTAWRRVSNAGQDRFYTRLANDDGIMHESIRSLRLMEKIGLTMPSFPKEVLDSALEDIGRTAAQDPIQLPTDLPKIAVFPSVLDPIKQWPVSRFVEMARLVQEKMKCRFVILGGRADLGRCREFAELCPAPVMDLCDRVPLSDLPGVLKQCGAVLSCDSGGAHLAGILNLPLVVIFSQTPDYDPAGVLSPQRFKPLGERVKIIQPPADKSSQRRDGCYPVAAVPSDEVARHLLYYLDEAAPTGAFSESSRPSSTH